MNLTREETVREHRKMWNWIADQFEKGRETEAYYLKIEYVVMLEKDEEEILHNCFLCQYDCQENKGFCKSCPLDWGDSCSFACELGSSPLWRKCQYASEDGDYAVAAKIARQIANLPERERKL